MPYVVFLCGGIASGKSTVARRLEALGAHRIDLDEISREVTQNGSPVNEQIAQAFGPDVLDEHTGELRRAVLAQRAFASAKNARTLEAITHPAIRELLRERLAQHGVDDVCVVEIPLLDRVEDLIPLADEVLCVTCPVAIRRVRAIGRGMDAQDFDARVSKQPTDAYLASKATAVLNNEGDASALATMVDEWWKCHASKAASHAVDER